MKTVERKPDTHSYLFLAVKSAAIVSSVFVFLVCVLMVSNYFRMKDMDPIHYQSLERLIKMSEADPHDEDLKKEIQELDLLARKAFFETRNFNHMGIYLLLGGLGLMFMSMKAMKTMTRESAIPLPGGETTSHAVVNRTSRWLVTVGAILLIGTAVVVVLVSDLQIRNIPFLKANAEADAAESAFIPALEDLQKNWTVLRGMDGLGYASGSPAPTSWDGSSGEGITWKVEVPLPGFSSPIIWGEDLFLSGGDKAQQVIYCYNRADGALKWTKKIEGIEGTPAKPPKVSADTGFAAATMTTNGQLIFAIFANGNLVALDFDGNQVWGRNLGKPKNPYGHSSSLIMYRDLLLVQYDHNESGRLLGIEPSSGKARWETERTFGVSWSSPILIREESGAELILMSNPWVVSYNPVDGSENWKIECLGGEVAVSGAYHNGTLYAMAEYYRLAAIDMKTHQISWQVEDELGGVSSPVVTDHMVIIGMGDGSMIARDPKTGEELWYEETDYGFYASPIQAGDSIYLLDRSGVMHIFKDASEFQLVGRPQLGEDAVSTPAFVDGSIYIRGVKHLFCIGSGT